MAGKKAAQEAQAILEKNGIDPFKGVENLVWAPNSGYLKSDPYAEAVLKRLKAAVQTKQGIIDELKKIAEIVSRGGTL